MVAIIMGSKSDMPVMGKAGDLLDQMAIPFELTVVSAHRTPDRMVDYARSAYDKGIQVIIAGAGGAAHLPGMVAALTPLPVIGVPVKTKTLNGLDSLFSIVQMPGGIPVATVAINNSENAALLAIRIISLFDQDVARRHAHYLKEQTDSVLEDVMSMEESGWRSFL